MRQYQYALTLYIAAHLLPLFLFLRLFLLNWWALPHSRCLSILMWLCFARLRALVWDPLLAPFWRIFCWVPWKTSIYLTYVDDTFVSFKSCSDALEFFDTLSQLLSSLSFTMEEESNGQLPFLDVLVERGDSSFLTSIYRKPTFTGLYLD